MNKDLESKSEQEVTNVKEVEELNNRLNFIVKNEVKKMISKCLSGSGNSCITNDIIG